MAHIIGRYKPLMDWLRLLGVQPEHASRVIIDIPCNGLVTVYVTGAADSAAFDVQPPPEILEARVVMAERKQQPKE